MKTEDIRTTQYALGELHGAEREEFEKELAESESLQRELQDIIALSEELRALPVSEGLTDEQRTSLREECAANLKVSRRKVVLRKTVVMGALGALAACLLLAPLTPWMEVGRFAKESPPTDTEEAALDMLALSSPTQPSQSHISQPVSSPLLLKEKTKTSVAVVPTSPPAEVLAMEAPMMMAEVNTAPVPLQASVASASVGEIRTFTGQWARADRQRTARANEPTFDMSKTAEVSFDTEAYDSFDENPFLVAQSNPLSTFSIDVDTASYSNVRRFLRGEQLPPKGAVRIEELVNYFTYDYPQPKDGRPFSVNIETATAPWDARHELVRIGLKGQEVVKEDRGPANLVFLIDVSGSMNAENKLPLLKRSLQGLVRNLAMGDRVAIVVYAGSSGLVLPSTSGKERERILEALEKLQAGGGTNGAQGIELAYRTARENFVKGGNNRVILCTDGDFNLGVTNQSDLVDLIEKERASGVFLSVIGFGDGNLKDSTMEKLADKGNGNYAYVDTFSEGRKVLVEQMNSTLFTIAKDVKIQVEFNPDQVAGYRLIGYENRVLAKEDFNDDKKDAGEIGAGHTVTALYEIVRVGQPVPDQPSVDPLKYQAPATGTARAPQRGSTDLLTVKLRYKAPDGDKSQLIEKSVAAETVKPFDQATPDFQFAAAVAAYGMNLRNSPHAGDISWAEIQKIARRNLGEDPGSYRAEFLTLIEKASLLNR